MEYKWALEHSNKQKTFNIDILKNILEKNINNVIEKKENDYQIIFIGSYEECLKLCEELKKMQETIEKVREFLENNKVNND